MSRVVTVRRFRDPDTDAVSALWHTVFADEGDYRGPEQIIARRRVRQRDLFLVAVVDGRVGGAVLGGYDGHRGWLYRLAVLPELRRRGVGRALVLEVERRLRARGCPKLNLQIEGPNAAVGAFYERLGFAVEDRISMGKRL